MSRPKHGRKSKRYVHPDEIKLSEQTPADGQYVAFRLYGNKTYYGARYDAAGKCFRYEDGQHQSAEYIMGWLPQLSTNPRKGDRRFLASWYVEIDEEHRLLEEPKALLKDALRLAKKYDGRVIEQIYMMTEAGFEWTYVADYDAEGNLC